MEHEFSINGYTGIAIIPAGNEKKETWLVFSGLGGNSATMQAQTKLEEQADDVNIIYFTAPMRNELNRWDDSNSADANGVMAAVLELAQIYGIDLGNIKIAGHSNGGFFCYLLMKLFKYTIKGAVVINAALQLNAGSSYDKNIVAINGGLDDVVVKEGGTFTTRSFHSLLDTAKICQEGGANFKQLYYASAPHNLTVTTDKLTSLQSAMEKAKDDMTNVIVNELYKM